MEPKRKLKHIPIWQFFTRMKTLEKVLFTVLFAALLASAAWAVVAANNPSQWVQEIGEVSEGRLHEIPLRTYTQNYRTMSTEVGAWKEDVLYYASIITPTKPLVIGFILLQILGWAFLLTSATYVRHFLSYVVFLAFTILVVVANSMGPELTPLDWAINIGLAALLLGAAGVFQQGILKFGYALRLLIFLVIAAAPFGLQYFQGGWVQLHGATVGMMPILVVVGLIYLFMISNDISNLIFFVASNAKNKKYRVGFPIIFSVFLVVTAIEFVLVQKEMGWNLLSKGDDIQFRPIHLMIIASIVMVGTKQNLFPLLRERLTNVSMSMGLAAMGVIGVSFMAYEISMGEYLFLHLVERFAALLFFFTGIFHFFYVFYNFSPLIRARLNFYYLSMLPRRLMYFFVIAASVGGTIAVEAADQAPSKRLYSSAFYNQLGDHALLNGKSNQAMLHYKTSTGFARGSVKGNFNLAMLEINTGGSLGNATEYFRHSCDFKKFAPSYINWSNLEQSQLSPRQAAIILSDATKYVDDPIVWSNLAKAFFQTNQPDSAILALKEALRLDPENSAYYGKMGHIYMEYDKIDEAKKFFEAGLKTPVIHPLTVSNALFFNMSTDGDLDVPEEILQLPKFKNRWESIYNFALDRYKDGDIASAKRILTRGRGEVDLVNDSLGTVSMRPDSLLLDGMLKFEEGDIDKAISRMDYIDVNFPSFRPYTSHFLGVAFFGQGIPEMAAAFFKKSVENGRYSDLLSEAMMEFDRGNLDYAFMQLNLARVQDSSIIAEVNTEMAKVQLANGDYFYASLGFDMNSLTASDWMQIGIASGKRNNRAAALEGFRRAIEKDPTSSAPYLEMARISLRLKDSLALENLQPALDMQPNDLEINLAYASILLAKGETAKAEGVLKKFEAESGNVRTFKLSKAALMAAKGDTSGAIAAYELLRKENPIDPATLLPLSDLYLGTEQSFEGQNMLLEAININPENPDFWYAIAQFERQLNRPEEAGANARQAMDHSASLEKSKAIAAEFKEEIAKFLILHPSEEE